MSVLNIAGASAALALAIPCPAAAQEASPDAAPKRPPLEVLERIIETRTPQTRIETPDHDRISARLARFIDANGPRVIAAAPRWRVPTLLLYAGDDHLVSPAGSRAFAAAAPPSVVSAKCFDALYHEIFNEADAAPVFQALKDWLDRLAPPA